MGDEDREDRAEVVPTPTLAERVTELERMRSQIDELATELSRLDRLVGTILTEVGLK